MHMSHYREEKLSNTQLLTTSHSKEEGQFILTSNLSLCWVDGVGILYYYSYSCYCLVHSLKKRRPSLLGLIGQTYDNNFSEKTNQK